MINNTLLNVPKELIQVKYMSENEVNVGRPDKQNPVLTIERYYSYAFCCYSKAKRKKILRLKDYCFGSQSTFQQYLKFISNAVYPVVFGGLNSHRSVYYLKKKKERIVEILLLLEQLGRSNNKGD